MRITQVFSLHDGHYSQPQLFIKWMIQNVEIHLTTLLPSSTCHNSLDRIVKKFRTESDNDRTHVAESPARCIPGRVSPSDTAQWHYPVQVKQNEKQLLWTIKTIKWVSSSSRQVKITKVPDNGLNDIFRQNYVKVVGRKKY